MNAEHPIGPHTTVREAVTRYPGIEAIFEKHGIMGCGGPSGPTEPIAFFAHVHNVEPADLIRELNEFALRGAKAVPVVAVEDTTARQGDYFTVPVATSILLAVLVGFPLGILVAYAAVRDAGIGARWIPLVQAHGHLQVMGWVGLFIMGIAYHVVPRFKATALRFSDLVWPSVLFVAGGVVLRTASQPWTDVPGLGGLLTASAAFELAGAGAFALVMTATIAGSSRRENYDAFIVAASLWWAAAAVANLIVVAGLTTDGPAVVPQTKNDPLLAMQFYGFIVLFILGVSLRVLPVFLNLRPATAPVFAPALVLFNGGLALRVASGWAEAYAGWDPPVAVESLAAYLIAASVLAFALALNVFLPSTGRGVADSERAYGRLIRAAYAWLAVAAGLELWLATRALTGGSDAGLLETGGVRHALALGFMTQMILGVGVRVLPVFTGRRLYSQRLVDASFLLINVAALTRVAPAVIDAGSTTSRFDHIAGSGALGLLAVALFGYNIFRTVRMPAALPPPAPKGGEMREKKPEKERFVVTKDTVVADVLERVPGALELLISYGFAPLADPVMRRTVTPHVTLETGSRVHNIDLETLLRDLNQRAQSAAPGQPAGATAAAPAPDAAPQVDAGRVLAALRRCNDPEIPANIVDLGLVYDVRIDAGRVAITMTMTSPDCPAADQVVADVTNTVRELGVSEVEVELVSEPAWDPSRMAPAARAALGWDSEADTGRQGG